MKTPRLLAVIAVALLSITLGLAEEPAGPPKPTPEHKAMEVWIGTWAGSGEMKPGPMGNGGPMSWTEECSWFGGAGFNVVCKSKGTGPEGPQQGIGIMGYDPAKKVYTYYGVDTTGWMGASDGTRSGDTWTFTSMDAMGGKTYHGRYSSTLTSPTHATFKYEISEDGETWTTVMDGTSEKK